MASLSSASYPTIRNSSISQTSYSNYKLHHQNNIALRTHLTSPIFPCFMVNLSTQKKSINGPGSSCVRKDSSYISNKGLISTEVSQSTSSSSSSSSPSLALCGETLLGFNILHVDDRSQQQRYIIKGEVRSRHNFAIRSYEVGASGTATIETILNLLQETGLNHTKMTGLCGGGFGLTNGMIRHNLIWVMSRMQIHIEQYPIWDETIEIDVCFGASGRHGIRCDWILRNRSTGIIYAWATSKWAMMNCESRRLSKMPDEVREELSPWLSKNHAIQHSESQEKIEKLDIHAQHVHTGLKPRWGDMDMNQHVNNVKYVRWMLESIPDNIMKGYFLSDITIEFKKECGFSDVIQSLSEPRESCGLNGYSFPSGISSKVQGERWKQEIACQSYIHLLQTEGQSKNCEVVRGKTRWMEHHNMSTEQ